MKNECYEKPSLEIIKLEIETAILQSSGESSSGMPIDAPQANQGVFL